MIMRVKRKSKRRFEREIEEKWLMVERSGGREGEMGSFKVSG